MSRRRALLALGIVVLLVCLVGGLVGAVALGLSIGGQTTGSADRGTSGPATGWYEIYFTQPKYPDNAKDHHGGLDVRLVALMDMATKTLDVADYDFDLASVADAMVRAAQRNVRVRMVTDSDTLGNTKDSAIQGAFDKLRKARIPIVDDQRQAIMHDKFTIVDGEWVSTGSWNYTDGDTYRLNNNMIIIHSDRLAANYIAEFEKMFVDRKFGPAKTKGVPFPTLTIDGARVENYFAPKDEVGGRIVAKIKEAKQSIYFMAFSFTDDAIGSEIRGKAKSGLKVSGVFETTGSNTPYSEYTKMKAERLDVYQDGNPYVMHHKVIILDEKTVIFGSFNFSQSADESNDENLLIVEDAGLAKAFKGEFDRVLAQAKQK